MGIHGRNYCSCDCFSQSGHRTHNPSMRYGDLYEAAGAADAAACSRIGSCGGLR
jgi:hypothetical protein